MTPSMLEALISDK